MTLTNEQIQAILDGAPKGVRGYNIEESHEGYSYYFVSILDLDLLREIITLRQEVERLKVEVESKNHDIIEAVKKARTQWAREDVEAIKRRESEVEARAELPTCQSCGGVLVAMRGECNMACSECGVSYCAPTTGAR